MSKKDRLKAQKEKQDKILKESEKQELLEIEEAKGKMSKAAKKYRKKAGIESKKNYDGFLMKVLRLLTLIALIYPGLYYCIITVSGIAMGKMSNTPKWVATVMAIGMGVIIIGVVLAFLKKYIISFVIVLAGTIAYMKGARYIVHFLSKKIANYSGAKPSLMTLDKQYMWYYYPIMIVTLLTFIMALISFVRKIKKKKRIQRARDNAPVKSIIEE
ncbi:MAG: hypothetical protein IJU04_06255 [Ruminococcus sp.]|nr:hypothetical protein [Ruminococcus sp.]